VKEHELPYRPFRVSASLESFFLRLDAAQMTREKLESIQTLIWQKRKVEHDLCSAVQNVLRGQSR